MISKLLMPHKFKKIGWCLFVPALIMGVITAIMGFNYQPEWLNIKMFAIISDQVFEPSHFFGFVKTNITNDIIGILFIAGGLMVGFSREKTEDEFIAGLRLSSLLWAVYANYILLMLCFLFVYGEPFFTVMVYNMFTVLIIFIVRFNYVLYKNSKIPADEK